MSVFEVAPAQVLDELRRLREHDAPSSGGHVLSYVYDSGLAELDRLAEDAALAVLHLNGLDPLVFSSIGQMERDTVAFVRDLLHGTATGAPDDVVGTLTSGGTESILLAVKTARDLHPDASIVLAPSTRHPAFAKAAHLLGLELVSVPVDATGRVDVEQYGALLGPGVALAVVSAPSYPFGVSDPVARIAALCTAAGVDLHVDACVGGLALPFIDGLDPWDLSVPGVTSISADLHKYGYAPKGASVLLHRGRDRQRSQYFSDVSWPGYPVVTSTLLGSRQAAGLAGAWATTRALGRSGLATLMAQVQRASAAIVDSIGAIDGLRVVGAPVGPLIAVASDDASESPLDPLLVVDALGERGWMAQHQPGLVQSDGTHLPATMHLTVTPVTEARLDALLPALADAAESVRGREPSRAVAARAVEALIAAVAQSRASSAGDALDAAAAQRLLQAIGAGAPSATAAASDDAAAFSGAMPEAPMSLLVAIAEALPADVANRLLVELLASRLEP